MEKIIHTGEDYQRAMLACYRALGRLLALPLDELHAMQEKADAAGWMIDPTLYRAKAPAMREDANVVKALRAAVQATPEELLKLRDLFIAAEQAGFVEP
jgi:hypothetical protein